MDIDDKRRIIHIDMDAFFASVEQRDFPEYRGKPVVVSRDNKRSVVAAASYEARQFGIKSAMPLHVAKSRCKGLVIANPRFDAYKEVSDSIRKIFSDYTSLIEPLSLDEAYLDVTELCGSGIYATSIAQEIRARIDSELNLAASAGVSYNKFLAKIASDVNKPNGMFVIRHEDAEGFLNRLKISRFFGVGAVTAKRFYQLGILYGVDLLEYEESNLVRLFGKTGSYLYSAVRGIDRREVVPFRERKSIGVERTFEENIYKRDDIKEKLGPIVDELWSRTQKADRFGRTVTVKVKFADFTVITRGRTVDNFVVTKSDLYLLAYQLTPYREIELHTCRLLGVSISNLDSESDSGEPPKEEVIQLKLDLFRDEYI